MARLVSYCRVSSEMQRDNTSLEVQQEKIEQYCAFSGHELVASFADAASASGKKIRPQFQAALWEVYSGEADGIICMKLDRFARSTIEGLEVAAELKRREKQLVILDLNLDTSTPIGECVFSVLLAFAELERETINERTRAGQRAVRDAGGYSAGCPPYGWDALGKSLVPNLDEQRVRSMIVDWSKDGRQTPSWIAKELNRLGIPAKRGGIWYPSSVQKILVRRLKLAPLLPGVEETIHVGA